MKINILPIKSSLHDGVYINDETKKLLAEIESISEFSFSITGKESFYQSDLSLILVQSGGSEGSFLKMEKNLKEPYYLLTYGTNNSLAASMEILSYLKAKNKKAEILHGTSEYISTRLLKLTNELKKEAKPINLGVIGKPSDWLIASNVDYDLCFKKYNINLIDIEIDELVDLYNSIDVDKYENNLILDFDQTEVKKAKKVSKALNHIKNKYNLKGLTIRCFDLLGKIETTGCLGLSLLNRDNVIGSCEGDIPAMLSMYILNEITNQPGFQANPSRIDAENREIVFAHCTLPYDMVTNHKILTHYESGIGLAIRGELKETDITVFKLSNNLKDYYVSEGKIIENLCEDNLCRTQIKIKLDDVEYFLKSPYGNHHIIVYGKHRDEIIEYLKNI